MEILLDLGLVDGALLPDPRPAVTVRSAEHTVQHRRRLRLVLQLLMVRRAAYPESSFCRRVRAARSHPARKRGAAGSRR